MDIILKVSPEALRSKATEVERDVKRLESEFTQIQDIISRTQGYWIGQAGDKARQAFQDQKEDTETIMRRFREHPRDLMSMAGIYEQTEQDVLSDNQELPIDVIV